MSRLTVGLMVVALTGAAGWAVQRAFAAPQKRAADGGGSQQASTPESIDPKMIVTPKGDIDPKMVKPMPNVDPRMVVRPQPPVAPKDRQPPNPSEH